MPRSPSILPRRWSSDLGIPWAPGIIAWEVFTCPSHSVTVRSRSDAGRELRAVLNAGGCACGHRYVDEDRVDASGRPWLAVADEYDPDPEPSLSELFAHPSMLGGVSRFARA